MEGKVESSRRLPEVCPSYRVLHPPCLPPALCPRYADTHLHMAPATTQPLAPSRPHLTAFPESPEEGISLHPRASSAPPATPSTFLHNSSPPSPRAAPPQTPPTF